MVVVVEVVLCTSGCQCARLSPHRPWWAEGDCRAPGRHFNFFALFLRFSCMCVVVVVLSTVAVSVLVSLLIALGGRGEFVERLAGTLIFLLFS